MPYRISGLRLGVRVHTSSGLIANGEIPEGLRKEIIAQGYRLEKCDGVPERKPTAEELVEMAAADKYLGISRGDARSRTDQEIAVRMEKLLRPMRKGPHLFERQRD